MTRERGFMPTNQENIVPSQDETADVYIENEKHESRTTHETNANSVEQSVEAKAATFLKGITKAASGMTY